MDSRDLAIVLLKAVEDFVSSKLRLNEFVHAYLISPEIGSYCCEACMLEFERESKSATLHKCPCRHKVLQMELDYTK